MVKNIYELQILANYTKAFNIIEMCWNQSLILSASSLHAKRYNTCIYLKYVNKSLKENINFEENIFVLTVLSYRKIPTGREEVFTLRVFSFLWAYIHHRGW